MNPLVSLDSFCREERPRLVRSLTAYCGDREQAEEIAQDALATACDHWGEVRHMDAPGAWLHRVARNLTASHYRRRRTRDRLYQQLTDPETWHNDPDTTTVLAVRRAIELLPPRQRAAVTLRYLDDWAVADVARVLDTTEDAVKSLTYRGLNTLREELAPEGRPTRVGQIVGGLAVLLVAATIVVGNPLADTTKTVYIDPAPPVAAPAGGHELWWANSTATITGATTDTLELTDLVTARADDPMYGEPLETVDLTLRAPDHGSVRIHGSLPDAHTTQTTGDLNVILVHNGVIYRSADNDCALRLEHLGPRAATPSGSYLIRGSARCAGLVPTTGGQPVDLYVTIDHELGGHPPEE